MSDYFSEARKLGALLLASEEAIRLADANAAFDQDECAQAKMRAYTSDEQDFKQRAKAGLLQQDEMQAAVDKLAAMQADLKSDPVIGAVMFAEQAYGALVNQVVEILKQTAMGRPVLDGGGCGGGCPCRRSDR